MATYNLFGTAAVPGGTTAAFAGAFNLGTEFWVTATDRPIWLVGFRLYRADAVATDPNGMTGTPTGRLYSVTTPTTGVAIAGTDVTFALGSTTGWKEAALTKGVRLTPSLRYRAAIRFPAGFTAVNQYWATGAGASGITSGPLFAFKYATTTTSTSSTIQSSFNGDASLTFPNTLASPAGNNYFCDVTVTDVDPTGQRQTSFYPFL